MATEQQLSAVYAKWIAQVDLAAPDRDASDPAVAGVGRGDCASGGDAGVVVVQALLDRASAEPGWIRAACIRCGRCGLAIQLVTLVLVLLAIFGAPQPDADDPGTGAAGLTVVFQDFILAFFGWFVLMGKNGIRVGDWVEINGVGGEVVEIGLFRTALLETGNWTDKGHPTGRRVTFINSFAVTGQYFNFSTAGQWMWDEISVNVPAGEDGQKTIEAIRRRWWRETEKDAKLAEAEWKSSTQGAWAEPVFGHAFGGSAAGARRDRRAGAVRDAGRRPV